MTDLPDNRWLRIAVEYPGLAAAPLGALGVIAIWQDIGPSWLGMGLLLGGIGLYVAVTEVLDTDVVTEPESEPEPEPDYDPDHVLETGSRDLGEWEIPDDEAPWWDLDAYETTQDRIEAMKRQDPDYDDGSDESILDKLASLLGMDGAADERDDDDRGGMLDDLDSLFEPEAEMDATFDLEDELEVDLEDEMR